MIFLNAIYLNAMPPKPGVYKQGTVFVEKTNISRLRAAAGLAPKSISYYAPYSYPAIKPLIVLVDFPAGTFNGQLYSAVTFSSSHSPLYYENWLFSKTGKSLYTFYNENSGGKLAVNDGGVYLTVITADFCMAAYGADQNGAGSDNDPGTLATELAEKIVHSGFDLSPFDANSDGIVDALIIIHAGNGQEEHSDEPNDIWSFKDKIDYIDLAYSQYKIFDFVMIAETSPFGTFCHEFGHILGLPDMYNTASGSSSFGEWDLMDSGGWTDDGNTPSHMSAWCKKYLGWGNSTTVLDKFSNLKITPTEKLDANPDNNEFYKINILGNSSEYFLLEYRNKTGFDSKLPGKGMLVWHIDEALLDSRLDSNHINTGSPHDSIDLITADGTNAGNGAESGHLFVDGKTFGYPFNKNFSGVDSSVTLTGFSVYQDYMNFSAYILKSSDTYSDIKIINYPNPVKPSVNLKSHFIIDASRPISTIEFKIYDISGKLIYDRKINQSDLDSSDSSDYHFIYKFDWDCLDMKNDILASGVYIYLFKIGDKLKTGKLAILR